MIEENVSEHFERYSHHGRVVLLDRLPWFGWCWEDKIVNEVAFEDFTKREAHLSCHDFSPFLRLIRDLYQWTWKTPSAGILQSLRETV